MTDKFGRGTQACIAADLRMDYRIVFTSVSNGLTEVLRQAGMLYEISLDLPTMGRITFRCSSMRTVL